MEVTGGAGDLLGRYEEEFEKEKIPRDEDPAEMGKMDFLNLLITQLENQDPLDPQDDQEFAAQLAQFSSLEQMTNVADGVEALNQNQSRQEMLGAVSFIGKEVRADGGDISKDDSGMSTLYYDLDQPAQNVFINIHDQNGRMIRTEEKVALDEGEHEFVWDGLTHEGTEAPNGNYSVNVTAEGPHGESIPVGTEVTGRVSGVQDQDGQPHLRLSDGREISFAEVREVVESRQVSGGEDEDQDQDEQENLEDII